MALETLETRMTRLLSPDSLVQDDIEAVYGRGEVIVGYPEGVAMVGQRTINVSFFQIFLKTWDKVRSSRRVISIGLFPLNSLNMPLQSVNFVNLLFST